jgi:hypothetical protein
MIIPNALLPQIANEVNRAIRLYPKFNSLHEGYAILFEEVDELWEHVRVKQIKRDPEKITKECIQIAAMAVRIILDCGENQYKK